MYQMQGIIKISVEVPFNQKKVVVHNKPKVSNLTKQTQPETVSEPVPKITTENQAENAVSEEKTCWTSRVSA